MRFLLLASFLCLGCQPPSTSVGCVNADRASDFRGRFEHVMTLDDGRQSAPVEILWAQEEDFVFAVSAEDGLRLGFRVDARFDAVETSDHPCGLQPAEDQTLPPIARSHVRVDLSQDLVLEGVRELVPQASEPVAWFVPADDESRIVLPRRERGNDGRLRLLETSNQYYREDTGALFSVRHALRRIE